MSDHSFEYQMVCRLVMDLEFFFGWGNKCEKHLFCDTLSEQIEELEKQYNQLPVEPEWLSRKELNEWIETCNKELQLSNDGL
jgi:hypothetical protein